MFTPRMRRRRHSIDTYIRGALVERMLATEDAPIPLRLESPEAKSAGAQESPAACAGESDRLSA
jgi:hypothetical protein